MGIGVYLGDVLEKPRRKDEILAIWWGTEDGNRKCVSRKKLRTWYLACHIAWRGILDGKNVGEALSRVEALERSGNFLLAHGTAKK
jgi:hypothetical protein